MKKRLCRLALAAALAPLASGAQTPSAGSEPALSLSKGQSFPTRAVHLMVPFPPGGATDIVGRLVAAKMQDVWGQPVVVENKPGAGTVVGTEYVARSAPDGYTLGTVVTAYVINPSLRSDLPYDTLKDLTGVTQVSVQHLVMAAYPEFPANNIKELIALAKKEPGRIAYATPGSGTAMHLSVELLKTSTGIDLVHVPYKGGTPAQQDVIAGRVPILMDVLYAVQPLIKSGKIKVLALLSPKRDPDAPEFPVVSETVPGVSALSLVGIVAPAATPKDLVRRIGADIARAVKSSDLTERMKQQGMVPIGSTPEQFDALIRSEMEKWAKVVKASGAKVD
jgi:tripartite-type tricarboxylate transporter receptor subunit TctC